MVIVGPILCMSLVSGRGCSAMNLLLALVQLVLRGKTLLALWVELFLGSALTGQC